VAPQLSPARIWLEICPILSRTIPRVALKKYDQQIALRQCGLQLRSRKIERYGLQDLTCAPKPGSSPSAFFSEKSNLFLNSAISVL
jgi:hypothetical protein